MANFYKEIWANETLEQMLRKAQNFITVATTVTDYTPFTEGSEAEAYNGPMLSGLEVVDFPASAAQDATKGNFRMPFEFTKGVPFNVKDIEQYHTNIALRQANSEEVADKMLRGFSKHLADIMTVSATHKEELAGTVLTIDELLAAKAVLDEEGAPDSGRYLCVCPSHEISLLKMSEFQNANTIGGVTALKEGYVGRIFGFDVFRHNNSKVAAADGLISDTAADNIKNVSLMYSKFGMAFGRCKSLGIKTQPNALTLTDIVSIYSNYGAKAQLPKFIVALRDK